MRGVGLLLIVLGALVLPVRLSAERSGVILQRYETVGDAVSEHLRGRIGDYPIEVMLKHYGHSGPEGNRTWKVVGKYRYIRNGKPGNWLGLVGTGAHVGGMPSSVSISEYNASGKLTGEWELNSGSSMITGDWPPCTFTNPATGAVSIIVLDGGRYN